MRRVKMQDEVLNSFIENLIALINSIDKKIDKKIDEEEFRNQIDLFSKFIGYTNPDYKYNGTYLKQFVDDFLQFIRKLKRRKDKYLAIFNELKSTGKNFELTIDRMFHARYPLQGDERETYYIAVNEDFLQQKEIEIRIKYKSVRNEYIFCKRYSEWGDKEENAIKNIREEFEKFVDTKENQE